MRILHDYNYVELADCLYDLMRDVQEYHILCDLINSKNRREGLICFANDLFNSFSQHMQDFDLTFDRINRGAVPPEGEELYEACFYRKEKREMFNTPRIVMSARKIG